MKLPYSTPPTRDRGRPREIVLTEAQGRRLAEIYLATNATREAGSMEAAWVLFCESEGVFLETVRHHRVVGRLAVVRQYGAAKKWLEAALSSENNETSPSVGATE